MSFPLPANVSPQKFDSSSSVECFPYFDGRYVAVAASLTGGNVMAAFITMLQQWTHEFGESYMKDNPCSRLLEVAFIKCVFILQDFLFFLVKMYFQFYYKMLKIYFKIYFLFH